MADKHRITELFTGLGLTLFVFTIIMGAQTPPINTQRIVRLEEGRARNEQRIDKLEVDLNDKYEEVQKEHAVIMADIADLRTSQAYNRDLLIGFSIALVSLLIAALLQGRSTHQMVNGAQTKLKADLDAALKEANDRLKKELTEAAGEISDLKAAMEKIKTR